jgi:hypothetical protein
MKFLDSKITSASFGETCSGVGCITVYSKKGNSGITGEVFECEKFMKKVLKIFIIINNKS